MALMSIISAACSSSGAVPPTDTQQMTTTLQQVTTSQSTPPSTEISSNVTATSEVQTPPQGDRQFAYIEKVEQADDGTWTVTADYAQWLTGDDAVEAAEQAGDLDDNGDLPSGDYYILNENPRLRELVLDPAAPIALNACFISGDCVVLVDATIADWVALLNGEVPESLGEGFQWYGNGLLPYWLIFDGETIVGIEEQYLP